jgi:hypothetical protein
LQRANKRASCAIPRTKAACGNQRESRNLWMLLKPSRYPPGAGAPFTTEVSPGNHIVTQSPGLCRNAGREMDYAGNAGGDGCRGWGAALASAIGIFGWHAPFAAWRVKICWTGAKIVYDARRAWKPIDQPHRPTRLAPRKVQHQAVLLHVLRCSSSPRCFSCGALSPC